MKKRNGRNIMCSKLAIIIKLAKNHTFLNVFLTISSALLGYLYLKTFRIYSFYIYSVSFTKLAFNSKLF